jgi:hypothetical protein
MKRIITIGLIIIFIFILSICSSNSTKKKAKTSPKKIAETKKSNEINKISLDLFLTLNINTIS